MSEVGKEEIADEEQWRATAMWQRARRRPFVAMMREGTFAYAWGTRGLNPHSVEATVKRLRRSKRLSEGLHGLRAER